MEDWRRNYHLGLDQGIGFGIGGVLAEQEQRRRDHVEANKRLQREIEQSEKISRENEALLKWNLPAPQVATINEDEKSDFFEFVTGLFALGILVALGVGAWRAFNYFFG